MYLTPPDDAVHLQHFVQQVKPGGWWPQYQQVGKLQIRSNLGLGFIYAIINVLPIFFIWEFKFGDWRVATLEIGVFVLLILFLLNRRKSIAPSN